MKDVVKLLRKDNLAKGITVTINNNKLTLDFHVIVSYGVSILAVSGQPVDNVSIKWKNSPEWKLRKSTSS